jgi:hypothetical protein
MTAATVLRIGDNNIAGTPTELFIKVFSGEVLSAFDESNVVMDKHVVRQIASGKSASFPATWKVTAAYHTPGAEIVGQTSAISERVILIDGMLVSSVFLAEIDEAMAHYDVRSEYAKQTGAVLSNTWDKNVLQAGCLAARASATVTGGFGGTQLTSATTLYKTSAVDLAAGIYSAAQTMDEKDIPEGDRNVFVKPAQYYLLAQSTALINRDWGGNGSYSEGKIVNIAGMPIVKTNHLPTTNLSQVSGTNGTYHGDFTKTAALVMTRGAVGTVKLRDLAMSVDYDPRRLGHLIVSRYAVGHGILRPECAVELLTTS